MSQVIRPWLNRQQFFPYDFVRAKFGPFIHRRYIIQPISTFPNAVHIRGIILRSLLVLRSRNCVVLVRCSPTQSICGRGSPCLCIPHGLRHLIVPHIHQTFAKKSYNAGVFGPRPSAFCSERGKVDVPILHQTSSLKYVDNPKRGQRSAPWQIMS
jgi:hypothetical protein